MIRHILADRGEVDTSGDTQFRELNRIADPREHEKLWSVEYPRAQNDLSAGGHLPPLTLRPVNEMTRYWAYRLTAGSSSKLNPIEVRSRGIKIGGLKKFCSVCVKQDVQIRAVSVVRSDVAGG